MTTHEAGGEAVPVTELSYTEASRELDAIVGFFEQREVDVDQLVVQLERATAIVDELDRRVRRTRAQVEELVPRLEAVNRSLVAETDGSPQSDPLDDDGEIDDVENIGAPLDSEMGEDGDEQALF
jgi:exonuclease VII small subunit